MLTIKELCSSAVARLCDEGVDESPQLDVHILLSSVMNKPRSYLFTHSDQLVDNDSLTHFYQLFERRCLGEPIAYIQGVKEFWSLAFNVSSAVLIPRPDTETLIEFVLSEYDEKELRVLDAGTGSGAISVALASERPRWMILALDLSEQALQVAKSNVLKHDLGHAITLCQTSWCQAIASSSIDILISNPPYIDAKDRHLQQGDVRFEPIQALVSADEGLDDINQLAEQGIRVLKSGGLLIIEHGWRQASDVQLIFKRFGFIQSGNSKDLAGNIRMSYGRKA